MYFKKKSIYIVGILISFKLGYEANKAKIFPLPQWYQRNYGENKVEVIPLLVVNNNTSSNEKVECPSESEVILIVGFGQSNSANHQGQRYESNNNNIINLYNENCFLAKDPMLGSTGTSGSIWIPLANKLAKKTGKKIVLATFGVEATSVTRWSNDKDLGYFYHQNISSIKRKYKSVNYFLWIQGEADKGMNPVVYGDKLRKIILNTKEDFPKSKFMLSSTTYCRGTGDTQINAEQKSIAKTMPGVYLMGDTDKYAGHKFRYDDCHLSGVGVEAITTEFIKSF
jgi:hypothetical protein